MGDNDGWDNDDDVTPVVYIGYKGSDTKISESEIKKICEKYGEVKHSFMKKADL